MAAQTGELERLMVDQDEGAILGSEEGAKAGFRVRVRLVTHWSTSNERHQDVCADGNDGPRAGHQRGSPGPGSGSRPAPARHANHAVAQGAGPPCSSRARRSPSLT